MNEAETLMLARLGDKNQVFVFPSEVAADWTLKRLLALSGSAALPRDRCISWDRFKEETLVRSPDRRPVNNVARTLFLETLLTENARAPFFRSLIRPELAASSAAHLAGFRRILPLIGRTEALLAQAGSALPAPKRADLALLAARYRRFLKEAGLFEPDDEPAEFAPDGKTYIVFYPEVIADWDNAAPAFRDQPAVKLFPGPAPAAAPVPLVMYRGLDDELTALMVKLRALLEAGARPGRIAVTAAGLDEIALPMADCARRFDVPLKISAGRPLAEYPGVNFLGQAERLVSGGFGLRDAETLLYNRSLAWKEQATAERLLRFGLENNCVRNYDENGRPFDLWEHHLRRRRGGTASAWPDLPAIASFYRSLRTMLGSLLAAETFAGVKKAFTKFRAVFFDEERCDAHARRCLDLALERLAELDETQRRLPLPPPASPFGTWLALLAETRYVPPADEPGIAVYPYRVSAGIRPDHHFIVNASEEATRIVVPPFPFLAVDERARLNLVDRDLSDSFLALYLESGERVTTSAARQSFGSVRLPPPFFVRTGALAEAATDSGVPGDSYAAEGRYFHDPAAAPPGRLYSLQGRGMAAAAAGLANAPEPRFTAAPLAPTELRQRIAAAVTDEDGLIVITPTDLESFESCAFRFLLEKTAGVSERVNDFDEDQNLWYGSFMHRVFERFFRGLRDRPERFERAGLDRLTAELEEARADEAERWEKSRALPLPPWWRTLKQELARGFSVFPAATAEAFGDFEVTYVEEMLTVTWETERVRLRGKIDLALTTERGLAIVDYKKNTVPERSDIAPPDGEPSSFQIPCYLLLSQAAGRPATAASYFSFARGAYTHVLHPSARAYVGTAELEPLLERTRGRIVAMADRIRSGDFAGEDRSGRACSGCPLRPVCRRKYFLRFDE